MGTNQKLTAQQKSERIRAAQERERKEKERREAAARTKKIFTIVVCVILVLALGIPTVALAFLGTAPSFRPMTKGVRSVSRLRTPFAFPV